MIVCFALKRFKLSLVSLAIFSATLGLSGCSQNINRTSGDSQSAVLLHLSQEKREVSVFEDPAFTVLLNKPEALDEEKAPAPKVWSTIHYERTRWCEKKLSPIRPSGSLDPDGLLKELLWQASCQFTPCR